MNIRPRLTVVTAAFLSAALGAASCSSSSQPENTAGAAENVTPQGKIAAEIAKYEQALLKDPRDGKARLELARAYHQSYRFPEAKESAIVAADLMPTDRGAQLFAAEMLNGFREYGEAIERVTPLIKRNPKDGFALVMYGVARARLRTSNDVLVFLDSGWRAGRSTEVILASFRVPPGRESDRDAEEKIRLGLEVNPKSQSRPALALASLLCLTGRFEEAVTVLEKFLLQEPDHALILRFFGSRAMSRGLDAQAEEYFRRAADTSDTDSVMALASFYLMKGRNREALDLVNRVATRDTTGDGLMRAIEIEMRLGMFDQAAAHVDALLARYPDHPDARVFKAQLVLDRGQAAEAVALARSVTNATPWIPNALATLGRALWKTGDLQGAYDELVKAWRRNDSDPVLAADIADLATKLGKPDVAAEFAGRRVALDRGNPSAVVSLAAAQVRAGMIPQAEKTLATLSAVVLNSADALVVLGDVHAARGRRDAARASYAKALQLAPESLAALTGLLSVETEPAEIARIKPLIDQAAARHPTEPAYLVLAARAAARGGDPATAEARLRSALAMDPSNIDGLIQLSRLLASQGRHADARSALEAALKRVPSAAALQFELAGVLEQAGFLDDARKRYEEVLRLNSSAYLASARLAGVIVKQNGNLDVALQLASAAKQGLSSAPEIDDTLGWILVLKRRASTALSHLEAAVKAEPGRAIYRYHLGAAYDQLGRIEDARRELQQALRIDSSFAGAADARKLLAAIGG